MIKPSELYDRYIIKVEKNSTNDNISTDRQRFVELFNENQIRYLEYISMNRRNDDYVEYVSELLVHERPLKKSGSDRSSDYFDLPEDYFIFTNISGPVSYTHLTLPTNREV